MELIDKNTLLEQMKSRKNYIGRPSDPVCLVEDAPTVDAVPVVHGYWTTNNTFEWHCSNCGYEPIAFENTPYCPVCGAKMDVERQEKNDEA